jgi:hypothetical protein
MGHSLIGARTCSCVQIGARRLLPHTLGARSLLRVWDPGLAACEARVCMHTRLPSHSQCMHARTRLAGGRGSLEPVHQRRLKRPASYTLTSDALRSLPRRRLAYGQRGDAAACHGAGAWGSLRTVI